MENEREKEKINGTEYVVSSTDKCGVNMFEFTASKLIEDDGSVTLSLNEIDLIENAATEMEAKKILAQSIREYAEEYWNNPSYYGTDPYRRKYAPCLKEVLALDDVVMLSGRIKIS